MRSLTPPATRPKTTSIRGVPPATPGTAPIPTLIERGLRYTTYRQAIEAGLAGYRRRRAVIQLASTLRNLGHPEQSVELLTAERAAGTDDPEVATLDDAVDAFLALALVDTGHPRAAAGLALGALAGHLPRYNRSLSYYAGELNSLGEEGSRS